jgi:glyoxylase-like metal-dependent hydrolase (beta-lactamase superfamily II)
LVGEVEIREMGIRRISLPTPFAVGAVNVFLIEDSPLTLMDCGTAAAPSFEALEAGLGELGRKVEDIELLVLSHQHVDHMGGAYEVVRRSGAEVVALDLLATILEGFEDSVVADEQMIVETLRVNGAPLNLLPKSMANAGDRRKYGRSVHVDRALPVGSEVVLRDRRLEVLHRPGHTATDTVFLDRERQMMFAADHLIAHVSSNALIGLGPDEGGQKYRPLVAYRRSMLETRELDVELTLTGHGEAVLDHRALIDKRIEQQDRRAQQFLDLLGDGSRSAADIALERWGEVAEQQIFLTVSEVLGHMDLLVDAGRARREIDGDGNVRFAAA